MARSSAGAASWGGPASAGRMYRMGVTVALITAFLTAWTTVVRDDGNGIGFFLLIMAAGVGAFVAGLRSVGMARAMAGVALMQIVLGSLIATAPATAGLPGGAPRVIIGCAVFAVLWLVAAACFRAAAKAER